MITIGYLSEFSENEKFNNSKISLRSFPSQEIHFTVDQVVYFHNIIVFKICFKIMLSMEIKLNNSIKTLKKIKNYCVG